MVEFSLPLTTSLVCFRPDGLAMAWSQPIGRPLTREPIRVRSLGDVTVRALPGTEGAYAAFRSSDGAALAFFAAGQLRAICLSDGEIRVPAAAADPEGGTWRGTLAQGQIVYASGGKLHALELPSAQVRTLPLTFAVGERPMAPVFLPEGDRLLYLSASSRNNAFRLFRSSIRGEAPVELQRVGGRVQFAQHPRTGSWHMIHSEPNACLRRFLLRRWTRAPGKVGARRCGLSPMSPGR